MFLSELSETLFKLHPKDLAEYKAWLRANGQDPNKPMDFWRRTIRTSIPMPQQLAPEWERKMGEWADAVDLESGQPLFGPDTAPTMKRILNLIMDNRVSGELAMDACHCSWVCHDMMNMPSL